jgi:hypothetical protein
LLLLILLLLSSFEAVVLVHNDDESDDGWWDDDDDDDSLTLDFVTNSDRNILLCMTIFSFLLDDDFRTQVSPF